MTFFDNPSATLRWLEMPEGKQFLVYLGEMLELSRARLEKESETVEIFRRQGRVEVLKDIVSLPEQLRQMLKRKAA